MSSDWRGVFARTLMLIVSMLIVVGAALVQMSKPSSGTQLNKTSALAATFLTSLNAREIIEEWRSSLLAPGGYRDCKCSHATRARLEAAWQLAVEKIFDVDEILTDLQSVYTNSFTELELEQMLSWQNSPLGQKINALEKSNLSKRKYYTEHRSELEGALRTLEADPKRKKLIKQISDLYGGTKALVDIEINMTLGLWLGSEAAKPPGQPRMDPENIIAKIEASRAKRMRTSKSEVFIQDALMYFPLTAEDLQEFRNMIASPLGQKHTRISLDALNRLFRKRMLNIGKHLTQEQDSQRL